MTLINSDFYSQTPKCCKNILRNVLSLKKILHYAATKKLLVSNCF